MIDGFPQLVYENGTHYIRSSRFSVNVPLPDICTKSHIPIYEKKRFLYTKVDVFYFLLSIYVYNRALPNFNNEVGFILAGVAKDRLLAYIMEEANPALTEVCNGI